MKTNSASRTAQYMALFRAVETVQPTSKRLFEDPYAVRFLDNGLRFATKIASIPVLGNLIPKLIHQKAIGALSSGIARTKYIDDLLEATVKEGCKQLIILGAGFDTRSFRLDCLRQIAVIEIDHPDTSNFKKKIYRDVMGDLPANVSFQQADFNKQALEEIAEIISLDYSVATTIIWEGVSNYLTQEAVDATFHFTKKFMSPFNIIFTYVEKEVLDNPQHFKGTKQVFENLKRNEEQWTFGIDPNELSSYLKRFGLTLIEDLNATGYRNRYMPRRRGLLEGYEFYHAAIAKR